MDYAKLALAATPFLVALLAQTGIVVTETEVAGWVQAALLLAGALGSATPSLKAWLKYRKDAD